MPDPDGSATARVPAQAVTLEIVERGFKTDDSVAGSVIIPGEVRINGVPVLTEGGITVHEMKIVPRESAATVTLTLFVRKLVVAAEGDL